MKKSSLRRATVPSLKFPAKKNIDKILEALTNEPLKYRTIVLLAIDTGLGLGEIMGLKWADIEFEKFTLTVNKANQPLSGKGIFTKSPKNQISPKS